MGDFVLNVFAQIMTLRSWARHGFTQALSVA